jgi:hypothetical protein
MIEATIVLGFLLVAALIWLSIYAKDFKHSQVLLKEAKAESAHRIKSLMVLDRANSIPDPSNPGEYRIPTPEDWEKYGKAALKFYSERLS